MLHPLTPPYVSNPYSTFAKLRSENPVYFDEEIGMWVITRYDDARTVLSDTSSFSNAMTLVPMFPICEHAGKVMSNFSVEPIAVLDPPDHTRVRKAFTHAFPSTPKKTQKFEPLIRQGITQLIDKIEHYQEVELVRDFTWELPVYVILNLLGVPEKDFDLIKDWTDGQLALVWGHVSDEEQVRCAHGLVDFANYCHQLVANQKDHPKDDFIGELLKYRNGDDQVLTFQEITNTAFGFLAAGHETTSNLLSNAIFNLLSQEGAWSRLTKEPDLIPQAVEEILRYDSPVVGWLRVTAQDALVGDVKIPKGQRVLILLGSANHDENHFSDADQFIMERENAKEHLSFSNGPHFCVGSALARLEAKIVLEELTKRFPNMELKQDFQPEYIPNAGFRILKKLSVTLH